MWLIRVRHTARYRFAVEETFSLNKFDLIWGGGGDSTPKNPSPKMGIAGSCGVF